MVSVSGALLPILTQHLGNLLFIASSERLSRILSEGFFCVCGLRHETIQQIAVRKEALHITRQC